jgi:hypothetical protein
MVKTQPVQSKGHPKKKKFFLAATNAPFASTSRALVADEKTGNSVLLPSWVGVVTPARALHSGRSACRRQFKTEALGYFSPCSQATETFRHLAMAETS